MKYRKNNFREYYCSANGNSLAEFAVVGALMATLAATAAPKLSEVIENTKAVQTMKEIDKIITQAGNFYRETAASEGRGRFPGQERHTSVVGDYGSDMTTASATPMELLMPYTNMLQDLAEFENYKSPKAAKWRSVFGVHSGSWNSEDYENRPTGSAIVNDEWNDDCVNCNQANFVSNNFIPTDANWGAEGHREWLSLFSFNRLESPYQDGHYIYIVMPGSGSGGGDSDYLNFSPEDGTLKPPILVVADLENPSQFHREFIP